MKKIEPLRGMETFTDEEAYRSAIGSAGKNLLKGASIEKNGKMEQKGVIGKPIRLDGRLWICGGMGNKIIQENEEQAIYLDWEHVVLREVVPIGDWKDALERNPDARLDLNEYQGYAVVSPEEKKEYVLTGIRAFLMKSEEPRSKGIIDREVDKKRSRREPPNLELLSGQLELNA